MICFPGGCGHPPATGCCRSLPVPVLPEAPPPEEEVGGEVDVGDRWGGCVKSRKQVS